MRRLLDGPRCLPLNASSHEGEFLRGQVRIAQHHLYDFHPPSSISSGNEVPLCTCHEAQVCLRSWKRKSSMPARCFALSHAVELCWMRFPEKVKHQRGCCPRVASSAATASALSGMPRPSPDFVVP